MADRRPAQIGGLHQFDSVFVVRIGDVAAFIFRFSQHGIAFGAGPEVGRLTSLRRFEAAGRSMKVLEGLPCEGRIDRATKVRSTVP